jgi:hypothetical protein
MMVVVLISYILREFSGHIEKFRVLSLNSAPETAHSPEKQIMSFENHRNIEL